MENDPYTQAIFRTVTPVPKLEVPLDVAPEPEFDLGAGLTCPHCGGLNAQKQTVEDAEVAVCPCGCEFSPVKESVARRSLLRLSERRGREHRMLDRAYERKFEP